MQMGQNGLWFFETNDLILQNEIKNDIEKMDIKAYILDSAEILTNSIIPSQIFVRRNWWLRTIVLYIRNFMFFYRLYINLE